MRQPIRKLIGLVEESHTKEYLFQISAQTMSCRERDRDSGFKNSKNTIPRAKYEFFGRKEERGKRDTFPGVLWALGAWWARLGGWPRHLSAWARRGPPGQPQVPLDHILPGKIDFN